MKLFRIVFGKRRWMLLIPLAISSLGALKDPSLFWVLLVGAWPVWGLFWLAWWLSDGFTEITFNTTDQPCSSFPGPSLYYNSHTGHLESAPGAGSALVWTDEGGHLTNNPRA